MAVKKATGKKAPTKRAPTKKAPAKKRTTGQTTAVGDTYQCDVCGLSVTVDEACGCAEAHEILCCGEPMKAKRSRAR